MNTIIFTIQLCFVDIAAMIADGFCDWNLVKNVTRVSIFFCHGYLTSLETYLQVSIVVYRGVARNFW